MPRETNDTDRDDEIITVRLPRGDAEVLREILNREKSLNWLGKYIRNVVIVAAGGVVTLLVFGDQIKKLLSAWIGS